MHNKRLLRPKTAKYGFDCPLQNRCIMPNRTYIYIEHWWEQNIFCSFTTLQAFRQSSVPGALSALVTSVVLYYLTRATHWWVLDGKDETHVCGYIRSEFIHWALWRTLMMRAEYYLFVHHTTSNSLTWATMMSPGKDKTRVCGYIRSEFIHWALWRTLMRAKYFLFVHHTASISAKLSTWCFVEHPGDIRSVYLYSLTRATLMSSEKDETRVCGYIYKIYIYIYVILIYIIYIIYTILYIYCILYILYILYIWGKQSHIDAAIQYPLYIHIEWTKFNKKGKSGQ